MTNSEANGSEKRRTPFHFLVVAVAVSMSAYHVYFAGTIMPLTFIFYPLHLGFAMCVVFLSGLDEHWSMPRGSRRSCCMGWDLILLACTVLPIGYLAFNAEYVMNRMELFDPLNRWEMVFAVALTVAVIEAARRTVGIVLVIVAVVFLVYTVVGPVMPDLFWHPGVPLERLFEQLYLTREGIFNLPVKVAADFVFLFVLLGAFLVASGAGVFFIDIANALTGRVVGGPAKTAVVSSAFMGMLQGSSNGNVATTGPFTIPAMRRYGYAAPYAAGVEAVASTGGQITPPIMGASAFLMSEMAGIPYIDIMIMAVIPAFLYFFAVGTMVDLEARRRGLQRAVDQKVPSIIAIFRQRGYLVVPLLVMVWFLIRGYSPTAAGFYAILTLAALTFVFDSKVRSRYLRVLIEAMDQAPRMMASVTVACAVAGIIAGVILRTGLGLKFGTMVLTYSKIGSVIFFHAGGEVIMALLLTMIICVIIGMGVPSSAAYVVLAALLAQGLSTMGVPLAAAHLFIIYCASKAAITPPVAVASYTAAAVAGTDPWETSIIAFRLGISVFIIPYMFVFGPALLGEGSILQIAWAILTAAFGVFTLSVASAGWLKVDLRVHERILAVAASIPMIYVDWRSDLIGFAIFAGLLTIVLMRSRRVAAPTKTIASSFPGRL